MMLNDGAINAMYELSTAYVSPHHSEGWGLTLSDAMIFRKPVIATGYSGNLEFMNCGNSLLLKFTESNIRPEDCFFLFHTRMKWAYPDEADLERQMLFVYKNSTSNFLSQRVRQAGLDITLFDSIAVGKILLRRLGEIIDSLF